ncbi:putative reverse transcriptase domain-containing protein [Tanacetum coccineum]
MRPFGCPVTILNTLDPLGKFNGKADEGFLVGYSINSKAFRVFNTRTRKVEENLHITFLENKPNVAGSRPDWLFDIDLLTNSMNYKPSSEDAVADYAGKKTNEKPANEGERNGQEKEGGASNKEGYATSTNRVSIVSPSVSAAGGAYDDEDKGAKADLNNLETTMNVSPIPITRIHKDHPKDQIIGNINSTTQTRRMIKISEEHALVKPKKVIQALDDPSWIEAMQDELLQFKLQKVWTLVDLPNGKRAIGTKWVFRNKKDERVIVVRNKARLVAQGYTQEEGINYDEFFAPVARIEAIRLFFAYASFMRFIVYQMDVKSAFLYGTIEEEVYVCQPPGFKDPQFPDKVYKVEKALYGLHKAPKAWYETLSIYLLENRFRRGTIDRTLFIKKDKDDAQEIPDEFYVGAHFLLRFDFAIVKTSSTPIETNKALLKDEEAEDVDVHLYRSMIGSLMYVTASRPDIMFSVCACARFQVTPKVSHLHAMKRIFRYLKGNTQQEVLWIQNQMLDYGFNFMNAKIHIDNESTICIVKNPVSHAKTKHIEIRHHFIRYSYEKRLIQVIKIHTDHNVVDLLTKAFDISRFNFLIASLDYLILEDVFVRFMIGVV